MMSDSNFSIIDMLDRDSTGKKRSDDPVPLDRLERLKQLVTDSDGKQILNSAQVSATNLMRISSVLEWVGDEKNIVDIGGGVIRAQKPQVLADGYFRVLQEARFSARGS